MNILVDIGHPGHVHLFKNSIWHWNSSGHKTLVVARNKDVAQQLLDEYKIPYIPSSTWEFTKRSIVIEFILHTQKLVQVASDFHPDAIISVGSPSAAWAAKIVGALHIAFDDTEHAKLEHLLYRPFTQVIYTPDCFRKDLGPKQRRYPGFHELAYLHPNQFKPDPSVLARCGLTSDQPFFVVRFVSWKASHDIGQHGFGSEGGEKVIRLLKNYGQVVVTSERRASTEVENRGVISPAEIHHLLYFARMYIGEGGTMATEAALLGTPSIFVNTLSGGNWEELEQKYRLLFACNNAEQAIEKISELMAYPDVKQEWTRRRVAMLEDKIDVTGFILKAVEDEITHKKK